MQLAARVHGELGNAVRHIAMDQHARAVVALIALTFLATAQPDHHVGPEPPTAMIMGAIALTTVRAHVVTARALSRALRGRGTVTAMASSSLVPETPHPQYKQRFLMGTVAGSVGLLASFHSSQYDVLINLLLAIVVGLATLTSP